MIKLNKTIYVIEIHITMTLIYIIQGDPQKEILRVSDLLIIEKDLKYLSILGDDIFRTLERIESNITYYTTLR